MIDKIIAGGQPGAAAAALDVAIKLGLAHGGWCPGNEPLPDKYRLERLTAVSYRALTERAVDAAHGSCFFTAGEGGSLRREITKMAARRLNKPFLNLDLARESGFGASRRLAEWIVGHRIKILHVDGACDERTVSSVAANVANILEASFFLTTMETGIDSPLQSMVEQERLPRRDTPPATLEAALCRLERSLSLKDKAIIANMAPEALVSLHFTLGNYINNHFDLFTANTALLADCRQRSGQAELAPADTAAVIIRALWERLRGTFRIRVVK